MAKATAIVRDQVAAMTATRQVAMVVGASLLVALCARLSVPLPFTPVPLTLANFGVLVVGLLLGSKRGFAALALYLAQGAAGLPVFAVGAGGIAQLLGPTGGYLLAYPLAAFIAGWIAERGAGKFGRFLVAALAAEVVIFAGGLAWLMVLTHGATQAMSFGLYPFVFAEIIKITAAAGVGTRVEL
ncbi:MAG: biotin transporter BioY [Terriglobales bacterium]|jgi:biotin transport system substrate-specific component